MTRSCGSRCGSSRGRGRAARQRTWTRRRTSHARSSTDFCPRHHGHRGAGGAGRRRAARSSSPSGRRRTRTRGPGRGRAGGRPEHARGQRDSAWGAPALAAAILPILATQSVGAYALSEAASGSDAFALACRARGRRRGVHPRRPQSSGSRTPPRPTGSSSSLRSIRRPGTVASRRSSSSGAPQDFPIGRKEQQTRHPGVEHLRTPVRRMPGAEARTCSAKSARAIVWRSRR